MLLRLPILALLMIVLCPAASLPKVESRSGTVRDESIALPRLDTQHQYSLLYSLPTLKTIGPEAKLTIEVLQGQRVLASKTLHAGDPDFYTQFRVPRKADASIRIANQGVEGSYTLQVNEWPRTTKVRSGPVREWQDAMPIALGETVFGSGD